MEKIKINRATVEDIESLSDLLFILFTQEADFKPNRENQLKGLKLLIDNSDKGFVLNAKENEKIIGMVSVLKVVSTAEGGEVGILEDMIISPSCRGLGIGSSLLAGAIEMAKKEKLTRLTLLTDLSNHRAINFYRRAGFAKSVMTPLRLYLDK